MADGNGSIVIGTGVKILADGGDIPDTNYANDTDGWREVMVVDPVERSDHQQ